MRKLILTLALTASGFLALAQSDWKWAISGGDDGEGRGSGIATDLQGNLYVIGYYAGELTIGTQKVLTAGGDDIFIAKFDANGGLIWLKSAGGSGSDKGAGIAADSIGNIYVAGDFTGTANFGMHAVTSVGLNDIFFAKYDGNGNVVWVKSAGGIFDDHITAGNKGVALTSNNDIYISGRYAVNSPTTAPFGTADFEGFTVTSMGDADIFLAKYDADGILGWVKSAGGKASADLCVDIATDLDENIFLTGNFQNSMWFETIKLTGGSYGDIFTAKYNKQGDVVWAISAGGDFVEYSSGIATDGNGNVWLTGTFLGGSISFGQTTIWGSGQHDIYVAKYDGLGNVQWAKSAGWQGNDFGMDVAVDHMNNGYAVGSFSNACIFDQDSVTGFGGYDMYVTKYDTDGNVQWVQKAGGTGTDDPNAIAIDQHGNTYVTGRFNSPQAEFGTHILNATTGYDMFVAKLDLFPVGISDVKQSQLTIHPNPTTGIITIGDADKYETILVTDALGRQVYQSAFQPLVDLSPLPDGVYYLKLSGKEGVRTSTIVIRK